MDKRRANRVQGGWAKSIPPKPQGKPAMTGQSHSGKSFSYQESAQLQPRRQQPAAKIFNEKKELNEEVLSSTKNGDSIIRYFPVFLGTTDADAAFCELRPLEWEEVVGYNRGHEFLMPREMIWYGPMPYPFGGAVLKNHLVMPPVIQEMNDLICKKLNRDKPFNSVLLNHYRNNYDSVDWHSDDEGLFGKHPTIASVSLGETRNFDLRQKPIWPDTTYEYTQRVEIPLEHGSLLTMEGATQLDWQHRLRKEYHSKQNRINLTFRDVILPGTKKKKPDVEPVSDTEKKKFDEELEPVNDTKKQKSDDEHEPVSDTMNEKPDVEPVSDTMNEKPDVEPVSDTKKKKPDIEPVSDTKTQKSEAEPVHDSKSQNSLEKPVCGAKPRKSFDKPDRDSMSRKSMDKPDRDSMSRKSMDKPVHDPKSQNSEDKPVGDSKPRNKPGRNFKSRKSMDKPDRDQAD